MCPKIKKSFLESTGYVIIAAAPMRQSPRLGVLSYHRIYI